LNKVPGHRKPEPARWREACWASPEGDHMDCDDEHMTSESGVIDRLEREGFTDHFTVKDGALRSQRGASFAPGDATSRGFGRYGGVPDPRDESVVYAIGTRDGVRGTLVDAFGAYADPDVADFVAAVRRGTARIVPDDVGTPPGPPAPGKDSCL